MRCDFGKKAEAKGTTTGYDEIFGIDIYHDACGLIQRNDRMRWRLIYGKTPTAYTGPDHARSESGGYIFTEATGVKSGDTAVMYTEELSVKENCNLTIKFYYLLYGSGMGGLTVQETGTEKLFWAVHTQAHEDGSTWSLASIHLQHSFLSSGDVQFDFVGVRGETETSDIGLDDITIVQECPSVIGKSWRSQFV